MEKSSKLTSTIPSTKTYAEVAAIIPASKESSTRSAPSSVPLITQDMVPSEVQNDVDVTVLITMEQDQMIMNQSLEMNFEIDASKKRTTRKTKKNVPITKTWIKKKITSISTLTLMMESQKQKFDEIVKKIKKDMSEIKKDIKILKEEDKIKIDALERTVKAEQDLQKLLDTYTELQSNSSALERNIEQQKLHTKEVRQLTQKTILKNLYDSSNMEPPNDLPCSSRTSSSLVNASRDIQSWIDLPRSPQSTNTFFGNRHSPTPTNRYLQTPSNQQSPTSSYRHSPTPSIMSETSPSTRMEAIKLAQIWKEYVKSGPKDTRSNGGKFHSKAFLDYAFEKLSVKERQGKTQKQFVDKWRNNKNLLNNVFNNYITM